MNGMIRKLCAWGLSLALLAAPVAGIAQEAATAQADARRDAQIDTNSAMWFGAGCIVGLTGVGAAYVFKPGVPASRLLGKSAGYAATYVGEYQRSAVGIQTRSAWFGYCTRCGCLAVGSGVFLLLYVSYHAL